MRSVRNWVHIKLQDGEQANGSNACDLRGGRGRELGAPRNGEEEEKVKRQTCSGEEQRSQNKQRMKDGCNRRLVGRRVA